MSIIILKINCYRLVKCSIFEQLLYFSGILTVVNFSILLAYNDSNMVFKLFLIFEILSFQSLFSVRLMLILDLCLTLINNWIALYFSVTMTKQHHFLSK